MEFKIDIYDPATLRGMIWLIGCLLSLIFLLVDGTDKATAILALTGTASGATGTFFTKKEGK